MIVTNLTNASRTEGNFLDGDLIEYNYENGVIVKKTYMTPAQYDEQGNEVVE